MIRIWILTLLIVLHQNIGVAKECTSPGNFQNDQIGRCENYTLCLTSGANSYWQLNLTCPDGFIFNHFHTRCTNDTSYQCAPDYKCLESGNFTNPFDDDCTSYIVCITGLNDIMTARSVMCPSDNIFDPTERSCVILNETLYKCAGNKPSSLGDTFVNLLESRTSTSDCIHSSSYEVFLLFLAAFFL